MDDAKLIQAVENSPQYAGQLEHVEVLPERPGRFADPTPPLAAPLQRLLASRSIERFYVHQVAALEATRATALAIERTLTLTLRLAG